MAALRSRCGHYIFALWFLLSSSLWPPYGIGQAIIFFAVVSFFFFLFPRLISAVGDWMSTILPHMGDLSVNLECAARGSLEMRD